MKVSELIAKLQQMDGDIPVCIEDEYGFELDVLSAYEFDGKVWISSEEEPMGCYR